MAHYELIVIGAGPGGYEAALHAAKLGKKVAVVEKREAGGTCLNRGCIPTKTLLHSSQIFHDAKHGAHAGIHTDDIRADMTEIFAYKREISQKLSSGIESLFKTAKIDFLRGTALITAPGAVRVTDAEGGANDYTCDDILIATGSVPSRPPIPGLEFAMTSDELLEGCDHLYRSIVIIGGGVIGIEFATFYADLGCEVTVIEGMDRLLPNMDKELGQSLALILKKQGVKVFTNAMVQSVEKTGEDIAVNFTCKEKSETVSGEAVLCAIGRRPYCDGLFADGISVEMNRRSIAVNERYETSIPHIYAIGDVSAKIQLAHVATAQGIACVDLLYGRENHTSMSVVPSCIYCRPEIAVVGLTEAEAKEAGIPVKVGKHVMFDNAKTLIADPGRCFMKFVAHAETRELLGAQLMCEHASVQTFPSFEGKDLDGNEVKSDELFSGNAVTVVNFWFTTCNPCVGELAELDALNKELAEKGGSLIGVNTFTLDGDEAAISEAKDVLAKKGATYQNVYFDSDGEAGKFTTNIFAYPTTYVVDRSGNIVGEPIVGAITEKKQAETLQKLIEQALAADVG